MPFSMEGIEKDYLLHKKGKHLDLGAEPPCIKLFEYPQLRGWGGGGGGEDNA